MSSPKANMAGGLLEKIRDDLTGALKARDGARVAPLRLLLAEIRNAELARRGPLTDEDILRVIEREAKRRTEAADGFTTGGRADAAAREQVEESLLRSYLPPPLDEEALEGIVRDVLAAAGPAPHPGKVMGAVMAKVRGRADGARVRALVGRILDARPTS